MNEFATILTINEKAFFILHEMKNPTKADKS